MTDVDIERLRELCDKATPGPWRADGQWVDPPDSDVIGLARFSAAVDAEFVAAARTAVPALLDEVERLRGERRQLLADNHELTHRVVDAEARASAAEYAIREIEIAEARLAAVRELHERTDKGRRTPYCAHCGAGFSWPCPTVRALDGEAATG